MKVTETNLGYLVETQGIVALLGGEKAHLTNLKASFPDFDFIRVKQTHGDLIVRSDSPALDYQIEADAHYTDLKHTALCISTADCIPVLIFDTTSGLIASVHAGWRGVANKIVPKTLTQLCRAGARPETLHVIVGPHIQMPSFEVGNEVRDTILSSIDFAPETSESLYHRKLSNEKSLVDLNQVLKTQLQNSGVIFDHLFSLHIDTFIDPRFHSYRRDKANSGRQLSFICKN